MANVHLTVDEGVGEIAIVRASARNSLSTAVIAELDSALAQLRDRADIRVVLLYGEGGHFCTGADLQDVYNMSWQQARADDYVGCSKELGQFPFPVVCAVEGYALGGGCELVEMADIVVASEAATFGHPELTMGTMPGAGGVQRLVRALGKAVAMDLLLSGRFLSAGEACQLGLVSRITPAGQALATARSLARTIAGMPATAGVSIKVAARAAFEVPLEEGLKIEKELFHETLQSDELRARVGAFLARRAARA